MFTIWQRVCRALGSDDGQDLIEYAVLIAILALSVLIVAPGIRGWVYDQFTALNNDLTAY